MLKIRLWVAICLVSMPAVAQHLQPPPQQPLFPWGPGLGFGSLAELRALDTSEMVAGQHATLSGYHAPGDGGEGLFVYDRNNRDADDGGTVIEPDTGKGRWVRAFSGPVNIRWFGARGDGVTDDRAAIDAALAASLSVYVPAGTYVYRGKLSTLGINGRVLAGDGSNTSVLQFTDDTVDALIEITTIGFNSLLVEGLTVRGPGRTAGVDIHGFSMHDFVPTPTT